MYCPVYGCTLIFTLNYVVLFFQAVVRQAFLLSTPSLNEIVWQAFVSSVTEWNNTILQAYFLFGATTKHYDTEHRSFDTRWQWMIDEDKVCVYSKQTFRYFVWYGVDTYSVSRIIISRGWTSGQCPLLVPPSPLLTENALRVHMLACVRLRNKNVSRKLRLPSCICTHPWRIRLTYLWGFVAPSTANDISAPNMHVVRFVVVLIMSNFVLRHGSMLQRAGEVISSTIVVHFVVQWLSFL